jgi:type II secretory pathway pseudopilin PulG
MTAKRNSACGRARHQISLVEVIIGLVLIAIVGAIVAPFLQGSLQKTNTLPVPVQQANLLLEVMEKITNDYELSTANLEPLRLKLTTSPSDFGDNFEVVECGYIVFDTDRNEVGLTDTEGAANSDACLKVVIQNEWSVLGTIFPKGTE